eukprot:SAG31_NODE_1750_length_7353_cov_17.309209_4_plen_87_part_00
MRKLFCCLLLNVFGRAVGMRNSRSFSAGELRLHDMPVASSVFVPLFDIANHKDNSPTRWRLSTLGFIHYYPNVQLSAGDEVFNNYG